MLGFYNILKPTGVSSTYVVSKVKRATHEKRAGHLGTLDPAASGVLPVAVGKATKFFDYFLNKDKVYFAIAEFGVETDTLDSEGKVLSQKQTQISRDKIENVLSSFTGKIKQVPPMYSALKIDGKKAYELAREGKEVKLKERETEIYSIQLIDEIDSNKFSFRVHCSAGTYIRTLLSDIAKALGEIASIPVIIREKSGPFDISSAVTVDDVQAGPNKYLISVEDMFSELSKINFDECDTKKVLNGVIISSKNYDVKNGQEFLGYIRGKLFGLFECTEYNIICKINLYEGESIW